jgi:radical SAM superfamily enzyme YgiQ (UPF0313 family)
MKILLTTRREVIERRNPIAILDLAAYLRSFGHTVDCYYLDQLNGHQMHNKSYDVVGLSVLQALKENAPLKDALYLKKRFRTETVVGGKWTQTIKEDQKTYLTNNDIKISIGAGEDYFINREIDFKEYPSWDRRDFETLNDVRSDIMSTRGCPYHCHFCHNTEKKLFFFSAKRTADNIEILFSLGMNSIFFCDDIFTLRASHMEDLYNELKRRNINIENRNEFFTHINQINIDTLKWIKAYKPFRVNVGIESGDDRMLGLMGKGFDSKTAFEKLKMLYDEIQLSIGTLFIIGFPGETEESLRNTLHFIQRIRPLAGSWVSYYQPVRGTKGYDMAMSRDKRMKVGRRNTSITYVDPNLTKRILFKYNYMMMDFSQNGSLRRRLIQPLIDILPYWLLSKVRLSRQRNRLKETMNSYLSVK